MPNVPLSNGEAGKGGGGRDHVSRKNKLILSQFKGNEISISRFTKKIALFDRNLRNL